MTPFDKPIRMVNITRIGLISDTHGNAPRTKQVLDRLVDMNIDALIHCGDIGSSGVLDHLVDLSLDHDLRVICVLGNVDVWNSDIEQYPPLGKLTIAGRKVLIRAGGKTCAVVHGDDPRTMQAALEQPKLDYLFTGHTHQADDRIIDGVRVINPGAIHRAPEPSFATLDLPTGLLATHRIG
ncbi:MAG: metallophosphoesterase family protein [Kiritimatiellae bacterium]|nr:metallophosphoesterase family protein [Kiritimatiellia bacterium]MCB1101538.1 metallophosphoesterase family protein [Kiritimatiellia bacterium]